MSIYTPVILYRPLTPVLATFLVVWFAYIVLLKASPLGTLGYRLMRVRIVDLHGRRPAFLSYVGRFLFSILGPFNLVVDLLWLWTDPHGQTLRDKMAHSYVVRARAEPLGWGEVVYASYHILGMSLVFAEVRQP